MMRLPECYRTGVRGRFTCLSRWGTEPEKWCPGCVRKSTETNSRSTRLARTEVGPGAASTAPAPAQRTQEVR
jgi:hypothetical protein